MRCRQTVSTHGIVPTTDFHGSEYVNDYFKCREYLSGFTGSAGTLAVTQDAAALWTDGRYFLQAETQLAGSGITLMREGIEGVPQLPAWLKAHLPAEGTGRTVGFDGRVVDLKLGRELAASFPLRWELDLSDQVWAQRPPLGSVCNLRAAVGGDRRIRGVEIRADSPARCGKRARIII